MSEALYEDQAYSFISEAEQSLAREPSTTASSSEKANFRKERREEASVKLQLSIAISLDRIADALTNIARRLSD